MTPSSGKVRDWRSDPVLFVRENFEVELDGWQEDTLAKLSGHDPQSRRRLAMKACTGPGKSALLAWIGWHRLTCFGEKGEHPKGAALSGEGRDNLMDTLWAELAKWQSRSRFLMRAFTWNKERVYAKHHPETWFLSARSYAKDADTEAIGRALSGLHSKFPFILLDEIGDMPISVGQKAEQIFTGGAVDALIAAAGNPTSTSGLLYYVATTARQLWELITITADPADPKRTSRVTIEHAQEMIDLHGRDNPWVMTTILGLFPPSGINTLLGAEEVMAAMERTVTHDDIAGVAKRIGIDVARFGNDRTVLFPRQGLQAFRPVVMRNATGPQIAARVAVAKRKWGSEHELIDMTGGYGASAYDHLVLANIIPVDVNSSERADEPKRYFNKRAEMWWEMAQWVKRGGCLPKSARELVAELVTPTYTLKDGKVLLEPKDFVKKKLGRSPDMADALALTFALPDMPAEFDSSGSSSGSAKHETEWDTFADGR
jgi:phage terminase large subunit